MDLQDGKRMFGDIKSKLGFGSKSQDRGYDESYEEEAYDDYDEFEEYADDYDDPPRERYSSSRSGSGSSMPRLVSIDDVRASTQVPGSLNRDPLPPRHVTSSAPARSLGRTMVDSSLPPQMTPEGTAAVSAAASRRRSEGLESLFEPTADAAGQHDEEIAETRAPSRGVHAVSSPTASSRASSAASLYTGRRTLTVVKPVSYEDASRVAPALKAGEVVVLSFANTPEPLMKRVLDFSFGAASALDASVECIGDKVFALSIGGAVSEVERMNLRNQGVL